MIKKCLSVCMLNHHTKTSCPITMKLSTDGRNYTRSAEHSVGDLTSKINVNVCAFVCMFVPQSLKDWD